MKLLLIIPFLLSTLSWAQTSSGKVEQDVVVTGDSNVPRLYYTIYFPPGYDNSPDREYPVVYFLAGGLDQNDWIKYGEVNRIFDGMIVSKKAPSFIAVMLCGAIYKFGNKWDTVFKESVIKQIDKRARILKDKNAKRAIVGFSLGGYYSVKSTASNENNFLCSVSICPVYLNARSSINNISPIYGLTDRSSTISSMIDKVTVLNQVAKAHQLLIGSDENFLNQDFIGIRKEVVKNENAQVIIRNGRHDWDFAILNLEPALEFVGDVFFGRLTTIH